MQFSLSLSFLTVTQGKSIRLETRVVFFRCASYIFTSSVQFSISSSSLVKKLWKKWRRIILNHLPRTWTGCTEANVISEKSERCGSIGMFCSMAIRFTVQRQVDDAWRLWAPMIICNKSPKISPWTTLCKLEEFSVFWLRKKVKGVTAENIYYVLVTVCSLCNCLLSASHKLATKLIEIWFLIGLLSPNS